IASRTDRRRAEGPVPKQAMAHRDQLKKLGEALPPDRSAVLALIEDVDAEKAIYIAVVPRRHRPGNRSPVPQLGTRLAPVRSAAAAAVVPVTATRDDGCGVPKKYSLSATARGALSH